MRKSPIKKYKELLTQGYDINVCEDCIKTLEFVEKVAEADFHKGEE